MKTKTLQTISRTLIRTGLLAAGLVAGNALATDVYHWKDANGEYHFGDQRAAPEGARTMQVAVPEQRPNPELDQYRKAIHTHLAALDAEREEDAKRQATQKIISAGVQQNCKQLSNAMRAEERVAMLYTFDDKGEMQYLDDQQRSEYKSSLSQQWQRYCN